MKKPRILKLEYFGSIYCVDLEEVQSIVLEDNQMTMGYRNNDATIINQKDDDENGIEIERLCLNTFVSWKNYDEERSEGKGMFVIQ